MNTIPESYSGNTNISATFQDNIDNSGWEMKDYIDVQNREYQEWLQHS
ncbi:hypothetical protein [Niastella sp. OAS944]|nr:hypothetical protein [Chitinophagaceae bacterium OAS944]